MCLFYIKLEHLLIFRLLIQRIYHFINPYMPEPTLQQVFGAGATQDATTLTIHKADLPRLTPSASNTAESLLTGILLQGKVQLTKMNFDGNLDQSIYVESGFPSFVFRGSNNDSYRVDSLTVSLAKPDTSAVIDPDDY